MAELGFAGYDQYEISNFALPGFQSQHNTSYWKGRPYLGAGPGAHSYNLISRQFNIPNNAKKEAGKCICCKKPSTKRVIFAKAY